MTLGEVLQLVTDKQMVYLTIQTASGILHIIKGEWYSDRILDHQHEEVEAIEFSENRWKVRLKTGG